MSTTAIPVVLALALALALLPAAAAAGGSTSGGKRPSKPALGFNHCSIECCGPDMPSAAFLKGTADAMVRRGLTAAGYKFVNMVRTILAPATPPSAPRMLHARSLVTCRIWGCLVRCACHACPAPASGRLLDDAC